MVLASFLFATGDPEGRIVFYFAVGSVAAGLATIAFTGFSAHTVQGLVPLLTVGLPATVALMMTRADRTGRTLVNASLQYLGIAFAFGYGVLLFDDPVTWMAVAGMLLIVAAGLGATLLRGRNAPDSTLPSET